MERTGKFLIAVMFLAVHASSLHAASSDPELVPVLESTFPQIRPYIEKSRGTNYEPAAIVSARGEAAGFTPTTGYLGSSQSASTLKPEERAALEALAQRDGRGAVPSFILPRVYGTLCIRKEGLRVFLTPSPSQARPAASRVESGALVYPQAYPQTDVVFAPAGGELEQMYYVRARTSEIASGLDFLLDGNEQVSDFRVDRGNLAVLGRGGNAVLELSPPQIIDSRGKIAAGHYELAQTESGRRLRLSFDDSGLTYPLLIDPTWRSVGSMATARLQHTATLLPSGKVLVAGGLSVNGIVFTPIATAEIYSPGKGTWAAAASMHKTRTSHTATLLPNGQVLVAGGDTDNGATSEIYDPVADSWAPTVTMHIQHTEHTANLLFGGSVLVAGGFDNPDGVQISSAEIYSTGSNSWTTTANMLIPRELHCATVLQDGRVLVTGGDTNIIGGNGQTTTLKSAEIYDPNAGSWSSAGVMVSSHSQHASILLPNGKVLVAGGVSGSDFHVINNAEIYDPNANIWAATGVMISSRSYPTATILPNGKILVTGGMNAQILSSTEIYDPGTGLWTAANSMSVGRLQHTVTLLANGKVLAAGGSSNGATASAEEFDPGIGAWTPTTGTLSVFPNGHTATLLQNGKILVAGGLDSGGNPLTASSLYNPNTGNWTAAGNMAVARARHSATLLPSGLVLVAGGQAAGNVSLNSAEIYNPNTNTWTSTGTLNVARAYHTATLLNNGVLVSGGLNSNNASLASSEIFNLGTGNWSSTIGAMNTARYTHTATLLSNGQVLASGGINTQGQGQLASAELFNPQTGTWSNTGSMNQSRNAATATRLPNGNVLVAGGRPTQSANAEIYSSNTGNWSSAGIMVSTREYASAVLLPNGTVLVMGGDPGTPSPAALATTEIYDPAYNTWLPGATLNTARSQFAATLLPNGQVLAVGGINASGNGNTSTSETALYTEYNFPAVNPSIQPSVASLNGISNQPISIATGTTVAASGSNFFGISEGSGGNYQSSPAYAPHAFLLDPNNNIAVDVSTSIYTHNISGSAINFDVPGTLSPGTYYFWAQSNAVPSTFTIVNVASGNGGGGGGGGAGGACATTKVVKQAGGGDCTTISACVPQSPFTLPGNYCIDIQDNATYTEQVTVQGINAGAFTLMIGSTTGTFTPTISPPPNKIAAFQIINSSVNITGVNIVPTNAMNFGIVASSPSVQIANVSITDPGGLISQAGLSLPSFTQVSNSTVSVTAATGIKLNLASAVSVSNSVVSSSGAFNALFLSVASNNVFTNDVFSQPSWVNGAGNAVAFLGGSNGNVINQNVALAGAGQGIFLFQSDGNSIFNSYVQGSTAVIVSTSGFTQIGGSTLVSTLSSGSGLLFTFNSTGLALSSSTVTGGSQGAGIYLNAFTQGSISLSTNQVQGAQYGIYVATQSLGTSVWITSNTVLPITANRNTYGIYLNGLTSGATIQNNTIAYRTPGSMGTHASAAFYAQSSIGLNINHNRFNQPGMITGGEYDGIVFNSVTNSSLKFNDLRSTGTNLTNAYSFQLLNGSLPGVYTNNIIFSSVSVTGSSATLVVDPSSSNQGQVSDYNDWFSSNTANTFIAAGQTFQSLGAWQQFGADPHSISANPLWANPSAGIEDFHPLSTVGRCPTANAYGGPCGAAFVRDNSDSPTLDAGDPGEFLTGPGTLGTEPVPNGGVANQGSTGQTQDASESVAHGIAPANFTGVFANSVTANWNSTFSIGTTYYALLSTGTFPNIFTGNVSSNTLNTFATFNSLTPNTSYYAQVSTAPTGPFTNLNFAVTQAATPNNVTLNGVTVNSVTLNWNANGNPAGTNYTAQISTDNFNSINASFLTANNAFVFINLGPNTTYFFRVAGTNSLGNNSGFAPLPALSTSTIAAQPTSLVPTAVGVSSITANWGSAANSPGTAYQAQISSGPFPNAFTGNVSTSTVGTSMVFGTGGAGALLPNTTYFFQVQAVGNNGLPTAFTALPADATLAALPSNPSIPFVTTNSVTFNWSPNGNPTGTSYIAFISTDNFNSFTSSATQNFVVTFGGPGAGNPLSSNTTYYFRVQALNVETIPTAFTATLTTATAVAAPIAAAPSGVGAFAITANWGANGNSTSTVYTAQISTDNNFNTLNFSSTTLNTSLTFGQGGAGPALLANTTYYFHVNAVGYNGFATAFTSLPSTTTLLLPPAAAAQIFTAVDAASIAVQWTSGGNGPSTSYVAQISTDPAFGAVTSSTTQNLSALFGAGGAGPALVPSTTYYFQVRSMSGGNNSAFLNLGSTWTLAAVPTQTAVVAVGSSTVSVSWNANGNPAGSSYELWRDLSANFNSAPVKTVVSATSYQSTGLAPSTSYYFQVRALNPGGVSSAFDVSVSTLTLPPAPGQPGNPAGAALGVSSIAWNWSAALHAASYQVFQATSPNTLIGNAAGTAFNETALATNTAYGIVVAGVNISGNGPLSASATTFTLAAPPIQTASSGITATTATISWSLNGNPAQTLAELDRSIDGVNFAQSTTTTATSFTDASLLGCTTYYYHVRNFNGNNLATAFDTTLQVVTLNTTPAPPNTLSAQSLSGNRVSLNWTSSPTEGITGYDLFYDAGTGAVNYGAPLASLASAATSYTTGVLTSSATYVFALRAKHRCGVEEATGVFATAASTATPAALRAAILAPNSGRHVTGRRVTVVAGLTSGTVDQVQQILFQFKPAASSIWTAISTADANHPNPALDAPFFIHWDVTGLAAGNYDLRAMAFSVSGGTDTAPDVVQIAVDPVSPDVNEDLALDGKVSRAHVLNASVGNILYSGGLGPTDPLIKIAIPAGALSGPTANVTLEGGPALSTNPPSGFSLLNNMTLRVTLGNGQSQLLGGGLAQISFYFPGTLPSSNPQIYVLNELTGAWTQDFATTLANGAVIGNTPHFSFFAVLAGGLAASNLSNVRVYPNPYKPNGGNVDQGKPYVSGDPNSGIIFDNLPASASIKIYTISGRLVAQFDASNTGGKIQWDAKNSDSRDVATGGYLAVISSPGNGSIVKKLLIIR